MTERICLIKSVISVLSLFYLSFYKAPVGWNKICRPESQGGLDIKDTGRFNYALITKWKWRLREVYGKKS